MELSRAGHYVVRDLMRAILAFFSSVFAIGNPVSYTLRSLDHTSIELLSSTLDPQNGKNSGQYQRSRPEREHRTSFTPERVPPFFRGWIRCSMGFAGETETRQTVDAVPG